MLLFDVLNCGNTCCHLQQWSSKHKSGTKKRKERDSKSESEKKALRSKFCVGVCLVKNLKNKVHPGVRFVLSYNGVRHYIYSF